MPQIMITVNMFYALDNFKIDEIEVFLDITQSTFNFANVSSNIFRYLE